MRKILAKVLLPLFVLVIALTLTSCDKTTKYNTNTPTGDLNQTTYATLGNYTLSELDLYNRMRSNGYDALTSLMYKKIVNPAKYNLDIVANRDELVDLANEECYGTKEADEIKDIRTATKIEKTNQYIDNMALVGVTTTATNGVLDYSDELLTYYLDKLAKVYYGKSTLTDSNSKYYYANEYQMENGEYVLDDDGEKISNTYYISEDAIESYYDSNLKDENAHYTAIVVGFNTVAQANAALDAALAATSNTELNATNVEEVLTNMYETVYPYKTLNKDLTSDDLDKLDSNIATLIKTMDDGEFTSYPQKYTSIAYFVYLKTTIAEGTAYADLDEADQNAAKERVLDEKIEAYVTSSFITTRIKEALTKLVEEDKIVIYDPVYDAKFSINYSDYDRLLAKDWKAEYNTAVAKIGTEYITVAELYAELEEQIGVTTAMDFFINKVLLDAFGNKITSDDEKEIKESFEETIENFNKGSYSSYPTEMGVDAFKFLYYGTSNDTEILDFYRSQKAWDYAIKNYPDNYFEILAKFSKQYADNYYNLSVKHILITSDYDMDGTLDDPEVFMNKLNDTQKADYEAAVVALMNAICVEANYIVDQGYASLVESLDYIKTQFYANATLLSDNTKTWAYYNTFNFGLTIEDLSEVNSSNASSYVTEFGEGVQALYDQLKEAQKLDDDYLAPTVTDINQLIKTTYGYHILAAYESGTFTSASYNESQDTSGAYKNIKLTWKDEELKGSYDAYNVNDYANQSQITIYLCEKATDDGVTHLPSDVVTYIELWYSSFTSRFTSSTFQNILLAEVYLDGMTFANTANLTKYEEYLLIQQRQFDSYKDYSATSKGTFAGWWDILIDAYKTTK